MYINSLTVKDLRCFREAEFTFQHPNRDESPWHNNITVLIGNNGGGKTTTLRAIALALLADALEQSGFVPYELVRRERKNVARRGEATVESEVILHDTDVRSRSVVRGRKGAPPEVARHHTRANIVRIGDIEKVRNLPTANPPMWEHLFNEKSSAFLVVGYGAQRALIGTKDAEAFAYQRKRRLVRYQRVAGLFEDQVPLTPLPLWLTPLRRKNPPRFREVVSLIQKLLPSEVRFVGKADHGEFMFSYRGVDVPSGALSDGYRAYLGWVTDLLNHLVTGCPPKLKLTDVPGVVLIDEVDLHLHPAWQREVIPTLSQVFPRLQFVLTTHSPIVVGTVSSANVYLLEAEEDGTSVPRQLPDVVHGLNAEQILLSSYFNLSTTRAPGFLDEIKGITERAQAGDRDAALTLMEKLSGGSEKSHDGSPAATTIRTKPKRATPLRRSSRRSAV